MTQKTCFYPHDDNFWVWVFFAGIKPNCNMFFFLASFLPFFLRQVLTLSLGLVWTYETQAALKITTVLSLQPTKHRGVLLSFVGFLLSFETGLPCVTCLSQNSLTSQC